MSTATTPIRSYRQLTIETPINQVRSLVFYRAWKKVKNAGKTLSNALKESWARVKQEINDLKREAGKQEKFNAEYRIDEKEVILTKHTSKELRRGEYTPATAAQISYLNNLADLGQSKTSSKWFDRKEVSKAIDCAKNGGTVTIG